MLSFDKFESPQMLGFFLSRYFQILRQEQVLMKGKQEDSDKTKFSAIFMVLGIQQLLRAERSGGRESLVHRPGP